MSNTTVKKSDYFGSYESTPDAQETALVKKQVDELLAPTRPDAKRAAFRVALEELVSQFKNEA